MLTKFEIFAKETNKWFVSTGLVFSTYQKAMDKILEIHREEFPIGTPITTVYEVRKVQYNYEDF